MNHNEFTERINKVMDEIDDLNKDANLNQAQILARLGVQTNQIATARMMQFQLKRKKG